MPHHTLHHVQNSKDIILHKSKSTCLTGPVLAEMILQDRLALLQMLQALLKLGGWDLAIAHSLKHEIEELAAVGQDLCLKG